MRVVTKQEWIGALRSGKYPQGRVRLKRVNGGFCCLGVLAEICELEKTKTPNGPAYVVPEEWVDHPESEHGPVYEHGLPLKLVNAVMGADYETYTDRGPEYDDSTCELKNAKRLPVIGMNDSGVSFAEIADFLEKEPVTRNS